MTVKTKQKKPWYIWLSLFGFMYLAGDTARRIRVIRCAKEDREKNFILWNRSVLNIWKLMLLYIGGPPIFLAALSELIFDFSEAGSPAATVRNIILLVMYFMCVQPMHISFGGIRIFRICYRKKRKIKLNMKNRQRSMTITISSVGFKR